MPSATPVPRPPAPSGTPYLVAAALMLGAVAALLFWRFTRRVEEVVLPAPPTPAAAEAPAPIFDEPPPPPPPPAASSAPPAATVSAPPPESAGPAEVPVKRVAPASECTRDCDGQGTPELRAEVANKARLARGCYERALRQGEGVQGRVKIAMRVASNGSVCAVSVRENNLGDPGVATCIVQLFRSATFPPPVGGCVDVNVPLKFEAH